MKLMTFFVQTFIALLVFTQISIAQTAIQPQGDGTETSPYLISNWQELYWISENLSSWESYFLQTADIDLTQASPAIETWDEGKGWSPIGKYSPTFSGTYAGGGHIIANLYCNRPQQSYLGLFGKVVKSATITDLGVVDAYVSGGKYIGVFAGECIGTVQRCFTSGTAAGTASVGGFIGSSYGSSSAYVTIEDCYSRAQAVFTYGDFHFGDSYYGVRIGAFIGFADYVWMKHCYATGQPVYANQDNPTGVGLFGVINSSHGYLLVNNYWDTEASQQTECGVTGELTEVAGLTTAEMKQQANFTNWDFTSVWAIDPAVNNGYPYLRSATGISDFLRLAELATVEYTSDHQSVTVSASITALNASPVSSYGFIVNTSADLGVEMGAHLQMIDLGAASTVAPFSDVFSSLDANTKYYVRAYATNQYGTVYSAINTVVTKPLPPIQPSGSGDSEADPYLIETLPHLSWLVEQTNTAGRDFQNKYFLQVADIDASPTQYWNGGKGWKAIAEELPFQGYYNGDGYTISGITTDHTNEIFIHIADTVPVGLFGINGAFAEIKNVDLEKVTINNIGDVACIAAINHGKINNCSVDGFIDGYGSTGAMVGRNYGEVFRCTAEATVERRNYSYYMDSSYIGGFIGYNSGDISESKANIHVTANFQESTAGFVGKNEGTIEKCVFIGEATPGSESSSSGFTLINTGTISNSYCRAIGALTGFVEGNTGTVNNCYSIGGTESENWSRTGFASSGTLDGNFWNIDFSNDGKNISGATGLITEEMKRGYNYIGAGWDFVGETENGADDIWLIHPSYNHGYPFLAWEAPKMTYIGGKVYYDRDKSGSETASDVSIAGLTVELQPLGTVTGTAPDGSYIFYAEPGEYTVSIQPESPYTKGADALEYPVSISMLDKEEIAPVGLYGSDVQSFDINLASVWSRCGTTVPVWAVVRNTGNIASDVSAGIKIDDLLTFEGADATIVSTGTDGTMYFNLDNLQPYESRKIKLQVTTPRARMDTLIYVASVSMAGEVKAVDTVRNLIRCSYDPNDVQVFPTGIQPDGNIPMGQELTYMIRFQNTGNDTAFMVEVVDTLASVLDPASFEMIGASHEVEYFVNPDGSMRFLFLDINLLDSTSNEPESHGFILFKVKPNIGLTSGTVATLQAQIYFDYNPPIVTNIAKSTFTQDDQTVTQVFTLEKGWNLISLYVQPEETTVQSVFFSCYSTIEAMKTADKIFNTTYPSYLNTLKDITGGEAYLIRASAQSECSVSGVPVFAPYAYDLKQGWNMIGCPVNDTPDFSDILQNANTEKLINYETIWRPEATDNTVIEFTPGKGYFIYTDSNGSILWNK